MFLDELVPLAKELTQQPLAFMGGFCAGVFRLNLTDDPLKSWLNQQGRGSFSSQTKSSDEDKPKSIDIE